MSDLDAIAAARQIALTTDNPAVAKVLLRGAELLGEKAASERFHRRLLGVGLVVLVAWMAILLRELAGLM